MDRVVVWIDGDWSYDDPKTKGSRRRVPQTAETTSLLRDYLADHPRRDDPTAPLFPSVALAAERPTGIRNPAGVSAAKQAMALANLTTAEAGDRLLLDWTQPYRHATFDKAVFRPAVLRANRAATATGTKTAALPAGLTWHALRHTYASLSVHSGIKPEKLSRRMGHSKIGTTLGIYVHLFEDHDADAADMAALGALAVKPEVPPDVLQMHG